MKMHLPLGLRRALFNTFIAIAAAAVSTARTEGAEAYVNHTGEAPIGAADVTTEYTNITVGDADPGTSAAVSTAAGDVTASGTVTIKADGTLNMKGYTLTVGNVSNNIQLENGATLAEYKGVLSFYGHLLSSESSGTATSFTITRQGDKSYSMTDADETVGNDLSIWGNGLNVTLTDANLHDLSIGKGVTLNAGSDMAITGTLNFRDSSAKLNMGEHGLAAAALSGSYHIYSKGHVQLGETAEGYELDVTLGVGELEITKNNTGYTLWSTDDGASTGNTLLVTSGTISLKDDHLASLIINGGAVTVNSNVSSMNAGALAVAQGATLNANSKALAVTSFSGTAKNVGGTFTVLNDADAETHKATFGDSSNTDSVDVSGADGIYTVTDSNVGRTQNTITIAKGDFTLNDAAMGTLNVGTEGDATATADATLTGGMTIGTLNLGKADTGTADAPNNDAAKGTLAMGTVNLTVTNAANFITKESAITSAAQVKLGNELDLDMNGGEMTLTKVEGVYTLTDEDQASTNSLTVNKGAVTLEDAQLAALTVGDATATADADLSEMSIGTLTLGKADTGTADAPSNDAAKGTLAMGAVNLTVTGAAAFNTEDSAITSAAQVKLGSELDLDMYGTEMVLTQVDGTYTLKETAATPSDSNKLDVNKGAVTLDDNALDTLKVGSVGEAGVTIKTEGLTVSTLEMDTTGSSLTADTISATTVTTTAGTLTATGDTDTTENDGALNLGSGSITDTEVVGGTLTVGGKDDTTSEQLTITSGSVDVDETLVSAGDKLTVDNSKGDLGTVTVKEGAHLTLKDIVSNDSQKLTGNITVSGASLTMENSTLHGGVKFEGTNTFTITGTNHIVGALTLSDGTTTVQTGTLTVTKDETTVAGSPLLHPGAALQPTLIHGGSTYENYGKLVSDVTICDGAFIVGETNIAGTDYKGELDSGTLTFTQYTEDPATATRTLTINTDGSKVDIDELVMEANGTIAVNGSENAGTTLTLHKLVGEGGQTLSLTQATGDSTIIVDTNNGTTINDFKSDINSGVKRIEVSANEALGTEGLLTMKNGSALASTATGPITISKDITANGKLGIESGKGLVLKGDITANVNFAESTTGLIETSGAGDLTFSGADLKATMLSIGSINNQKVILEGEVVTGTSIMVAGSAVSDTNPPTILVIRHLLDDNGDIVRETAIDKDSVICLKGNKTDSSVLQVDREWSTEAHLTLDIAGGTIITNEDTTLEGRLVGIDRTLVKAGSAALVLASDNSVVTQPYDIQPFAGTIEHTEGKLEATSSGAFGTERATVQFNKDTAAAEDDFIVELNATDGSFANAWDAQTNGKLVVTQAAEISGAMSGTGAITKTGETLTITGKDASFTDDDDSTPVEKGGYTLKVAEGEAVLNNTMRDGTLAAEKSTDIYVTGGESAVGALELTGDGNAAHNTKSANATSVHIGVVGQDKLVSATGAPIYANNGGTEDGTRGGQLVVDSWQGDAHDYADGARIMVAKGITGFDTEAVHTLVTRNVNLVEEDGDSYLEVSINHKGASKNHMQQRISDALTASEGATGRLGELVEAMYHTGSEGEALAALNSLGGSAIAGTMAAQMDASRDHMRTLRGAIGQPQMRYIPASGKGGLVQWEQSKNLWAMATGASGNVGNDAKGGMGYTRHDAGILAGADVSLNHNTLVGVAAGYSRSHVESCSQTNSADHYFVDVYGRYNHGNWSHSATLGAGVYDWDLKRTVHVSTGDLYADFNGQGRGDSKGVGLNFSYEVAYTFELKENHTLAPVFQLESSYNHIEGYREYGTLGDAGLNVAFKDGFMTTLGLGARYAYAFDGFGTSGRKGHVGARVMGVLDAADVNGEMTGRFIGSGAGFSVESTEHSRVGLLIGADTLVPVSKQWSVFGHASFEIREDYRDISAGAGVKYTF